MRRSSVLLALAVALAMPLLASARKAVQFTLQPLTNQAIDTSKLSDIVQNLRIGQPVTKTIGPDGGALKMGDLTLEIPKGALAAKTKVVWTPVQHPGIAFGWVLHPRDVKLKKSVWLHTPKADLEFRIPKFGSYVLVPDRKQTEIFHLVDLGTVIPTTKPVKDPDKAAQAVPPSR